MNTKLFIAATLHLLTLSACGPKAELEFRAEPFLVKDAIFLSQTQTLDLDQDGEEDDSITSLTLLISEKKERKDGEEKPEDLCKVVSQINAAQGDPAVAADTDLIFIQASQLHIDQTNVPFQEGDSLSGESLVDANGLPIDKAVQVTTIMKFNTAFFNIFSEGFGSMILEKLSEDSLNVTFLDTLSIQLFEDDDNFEIKEVNFPLDGAVKRAQPCPALSTFVP
jgi:hypothetical protein